MFVSAYVGNMGPSLNLYHNQLIEILIVQQISMLKRDQLRRRGFCRGAGDAATPGCAPRWAGSSPVALAAQVTATTTPAGRRRRGLRRMALLWQCREARPRIRPPRPPAGSRYGADTSPPSGCASLRCPNPVTMPLLHSPYNS